MELLEPAWNSSGTMNLSRGDDTDDAVEKGGMIPMITLRRGDDSDDDFLTGGDSEDDSEDDSE